MMRKLTQIEKDKLKEFRKAENVMWMFLNLTKIIIPLNLMIACLMAGFTIDDKILWFLVISAFIANFIEVSSLDASRKITF